MAKARLSLDPAEVARSIRRKMPATTIRSIQALRIPEMGTNSMGVARRRVAGAVVAGCLLAACGGEARIATSHANPADAGKSAAEVCVAECPPVTLASDQSSPRYLTADTGNVYWTTCRRIDPDGKVMKASLAGGVPVQLAVDRCPSAIAVDSTSVYWADPLLYKISKMPTGGGEPTMLASGDDATAPFAIAVDGVNVYWTTGLGAVMQMSTAGGTPMMLASDQGSVRGIAVDATSVYFTTFESGTVKRVLIGGGPLTTLASGQDAPVGIALHGGTVYWVNTASLMAVAIDGGAVSEIGPAVLPSGIAADDTGVYWTNYQYPGRVLKVPFDGSPMITLATGQDAPAAVVAVGDNVVWSNANALPNGSIVRLGKCKNGECI